MIIKRIICEVNEGQKELFYEDQKLWKSLCEAPGFLGQSGGWNKSQPLTACIYSFWESQKEYQHFMDEIHDQIVNSGQKNYHSLKVTLFQEELSIPGLENSIVNIIKNSNFIRVALAQVKEDKAKHFVDMQKEVWNKGMCKSRGMLGGTFASRKENDFLVLSGWESEGDHQRYVDHHFTDLLKTAKPKHDVLKLLGEQCKVEEAWRVLPKRSQ